MRRSALGLTLKNTINIWCSMDALEKRMATATKWSTMSEVASKLISPIVNMILARALTPSAFGIVATVNIIITFAEVFQDAGFQKYLIQHEFSDDIEFEQSANVAFWSNFLLSFLLWLLICILRAPLSMLVNNSDSLGREIVVASVSLPIFALSSIQIAICKRRLDFKKLFRVRLTTSLIPLMITVPLAFILKNHWALILGTIIRNVVQSLVLLKGGWQPKLEYSFGRLRNMLSFCVWTLLESITIWLTANMATFLVTRTLGIDAVGLFRTTMATVTGIIGIISSATVSVLFSALSRVQNDDAKFEKIFLDYQRIVGLAVIPLGVGMYLYRNLVTSILLGSQWIECADFVGVYALVCSIAIITNSFSSEYYRAKGKPRISMTAQLIYLVILTPATYLSSTMSFACLWITTCVLVLVFAVLHFCILKIVFGVNVGVMMGSIAVIAVPTMTMLAFSIILREFNEGILGDIVTAFFCVFIYVAVALMIPPIRKWIGENELTASIYEKVRKAIR